MKVYRALPPAVATFYEKQSDVPRGIKFEAVEFPFNASPKADFVAWMNGGHAFAPTPPEPSIFHHEHNTSFLSDEPQGAAQPQPTQPVQPQSQIDRAAIDAMWPSLPLAYRFGLCAMTMEDARNTNWFGVEHKQAEQRYGGVK